VLNSISFSANDIIGNRLRSIEGLFFVPPGEELTSIDNLDRLRITIGETPISFRCGSDGESVKIDQSNFYSFGMGEFGEMRKTDVTHDHNFAQFYGMKIENVQMLKSPNRDTPIGCMFEFHNGVLVVCNWGDDLKVWFRLPQDLLDAEGIQLVPWGE